MDKGKLGLLIGTFMVLVVGFSLLTEIGNTNNEATTLGNLNESITIASATGNLDQDDVITMTYFGNSSNDSSDGLGTDINFTKAGVVTLGGTYADGAYHAEYNFERDLYVVDSSSRSLINLNVLFFAIAIVLIAVGLGYKALSDIM